MTSSVRLASDKQALEERRDTALEAITERDGVERPEIRMSGWPKPLAGAEYLIGLMSADVFLMERLVSLAGEVDALRAEVAELRASKKGAVRS